jgi:thiol-disulfide isomerase/thioredoxin
MVISRLLVTAFLMSALFLYANANESYPLPEFTQTSKDEWLNSRPLAKKDLLGRVTLIDFWTYGCWNCYRSFPWLHGVENSTKPKDFKSSASIRLSLKAKKFIKTSLLKSSTLKSPTR